MSTKAKAGKKAALCGVKRSKTDDKNAAAAIQSTSKKRDVKAKDKAEEKKATSTPTKKVMILPDKGVPGGASNSVYIE